MTTATRTTRAVRSRLLVSAMVTAMVGVTACSGGGGGGKSPDEPAASPRPMPRSDLNVLVVVMDDAGDLSCGEVSRYLPKTSRLLLDQGRCYQNARANAPSCAPSRAALMTSQLGHNNGVVDNSLARKVDVDHTIQAELTRAGWNTYGTGKFFNGISAEDVEAGRTPSGFLTSDFWSSSKPYGYKLWDEETGQMEKPARNIHATTRTGIFLRSFIRSQRDEERPFYAYVGFKAPHTDNSAPTRAQRLPRSTPANRHRRVPPFRYRPEPDTRDKLPIFQQRLAGQRYYARFHQARARAQYDIDDEMGKTIATLREQGELDRTAIFFTSDQGYHLGENGWETKGDPYPTTLDVPLLAWLPTRAARGIVDRRNVQLIDVGPTIYDLVGITPSHRVDGRSMLGPPRPRDSYAEITNRRNIARAKPGFAPGLVPGWSVLHSGRATYVQFYDRDGKRFRSEFYRDPGMKRNLLWWGYRDQRPSPRTLARFERKLAAARRCAGAPGQGTGRACP